MTPDRNHRASTLQWDVRRGDVAQNLETAERLVCEAAAAGTNLCVLPELWASSFMGDEAASVEDEVARADRRLSELSGDLGLVVAGTNYELTSDKQTFNRARLLDKGALIGEYRKVHLFSPQGEDRFFDAGDEALVADTSLGRLGVAICYDLRFPELIRHIYLRGASALLLPSQWPAAREMHWRVLARARAIENQWFIVATNRCGVEKSLVNDNDVVYPGNSLIVHPAGEVMTQGNGEAGSFDADIDFKENLIIRRAIPVAKDRRDDVYRELWAQKLSTEIDPPPVSGRPA